MLESFWACKKFPTRKKTLFLMYVLFFLLSLKSEENTIKTPPPEVKTEKQDVEKNQETYSSLAENYILVAEGDSWIYEKYNDFGDIVFVKYYDKNSIVKEQEFFYEDKKLIKMIETEKNKSCEYFYDKNRNPIKIEERVGKDFKNIYKTYNSKNQLIQTETKKDDKKITQKLFYKNDGSIAREENYEDDIIISKIEYLKDKKRVHIYENAKELRAFDDQ